METIKYLDKVILPEKYILESSSGKRFKSIEEWVTFEKKRLSKYKYRKKFKYDFPFIKIINVSPFRDCSKCDERYSIEIISNNFNLSKLFFSKDLSSIIMQSFHDRYWWAIDFIIDYDFVYGNIDLDNSKVYSSSVYPYNNMLIITKRKYWYDVDALEGNGSNMYSLFDIFPGCRYYPARYFKELNILRSSNFSRYMVYNENSIICTLDVSIIDAESEEDAIKIYKNRFLDEPVKVVKVPDGKWFYFENRD